MSGLQGLVESAVKEQSFRKKRLVETWKKYLNSIDKHRQKKGLPVLEQYDRIQVAQCLENAMFETALKSKSKLFETTYGDNISFLGIQLPVIAALLPSLALNKLGVVQTLDRRQGAVFYLDVKYGQAKGAISADADMMNAQTGHNRTLAGRRYAMEVVDNETLGVLGSTSYSGTLTYAPAVANTVTITDGTETFTDDGSGNLVSSISGGNTGSITYTTGAYSVVFQSATTVAPTADYQYDYEKATNGVPQVNIDMSSSTITAIDFPLRADYTLGAAIDLEKAYDLWAVHEGICENNNLLNSVNICLN